MLDAVHIQVLALTFTRIHTSMSAGFWLLAATGCWLPLASWLWCWLWCLQGDIQIVHDIETGYGDPLRMKATPDFSLRFLDGERRGEERRGEERRGEESGPRRGSELENVVLMYTCMLSCVRVCMYVCSGGLLVHFHMSAYPLTHVCGGTNRALPWRGEGVREY